MAYIDEHPVGLFSTVQYVSHTFYCFVTFKLKLS